jgi:tetratricopeptide (TPR) repeat protein
MSNLPLPEKFKDEIFDIHGVDAIISIDRILFNLEEEVKNNTRESPGIYMYAFAGNQVGGSISCSIYLYGKAHPLSSFTLTDSIVYKTSFYSDSLEFFKILPEVLINDLAYRLGEKLAYSLTPSWTIQKRIIYTGSNSRMQEALSYSKNGKWHTAESLWQDLFDKNPKSIDKAKLANNIAIANELQDQLEIALHWAEKATSYFPENSEERISAGEYISTLQQRFQNNRLLDIQWRKE